MNKTNYLLTIIIVLVIVLLYFSFADIKKEARLNDLENQINELEQITPETLHQYIDENVLAVILLIEVIDAEIQVLEESGDDPERLEVLVRIRANYYEAYTYWINHPPDNNS